MTEREQAGGLPGEIVETYRVPLPEVGRRDPREIVESYRQPDRREVVEVYRRALPGGRAAGLRAGVVRTGYCFFSIMAPVSPLCSLCSIAAVISGLT